MAISWDLKITNVNISSKRANVNFKRIDSESALEPWTHLFSNTIIETSAQRVALLNQVWNEWQNEIIKQTNINNFITDLEQIGKTNLEAREV